MSGLLYALPWVSALAAAIDAWGVRNNLSHRPFELRLFFEAWALWGAFGLLALVPAALALALLGAVRKQSAAERRPAHCFGMLAFWTVLPVLAHSRLNRYTAIGGDLSGLKSAQPWLEVCAAVLGLAFLVYLFERVAARARKHHLALLCAVPALIFGALLQPKGAGLALPAEQASQDKRPNLLLLVWDTTRAQSLSPYGYPRPTTPALAAFAEQALIFEEARSVSCFTLTSHLSMLTGVYPSHHGARLTRMTYDPRATPSIAVLLREAGYRTGGFVGTDVLRANTGVSDGFEVYADRVDPRVCETRAWSLLHDVQAVLAARIPSFANNGRPHWIQDFQRPADEVLAEAAAWIANGDERPWFCFINLYDAHWPYLPDEAERARWVGPYAGAVDGYLFRSDHYHRPSGVKRGSRLQALDRAHLLELYDAELAELDTKVGAFLAGLDFASGQLGAILTSDHGEGFGEGGRYEHDDILEPQVRVPLLVRPPSRDGYRENPRRVSQPSSGVDVGVTLLAMAGLEPPQHMRGLDLLRTPQNPKRHILVEDRDKLAMEDCRLALYEGPWKLVLSGLEADAQAALYYLPEDPVGELDRSAEQPELVRRLQAELLRLRQGWGGEQEAWGREAALSSPGLGALGYTGESE